MSSAAPVPKVLSAALQGKGVAVTLKNGVVVHGVAVDVDAESGTMVVDVQTTSTSAADAKPVPHLQCVPRVTLRGSAIAFVDFRSAAVNLDLVARAALVA